MEWIRRQYLYIYMYYIATYTTPLPFLFQWQRFSGILVGWAAATLAQVAVAVWCGTGSSVTALWSS